MSILKGEALSIYDDLEIIDYLRVFLRTRERLWLWQIKDQINESRTIQLATLKKLNIIKKSMYLESISREDFRFHLKKDIVVYSRNKNLIFKVRPKQVDINSIILPLPQKMSLLSERFASLINIIEKENEEIHRHKRSHARKQAQSLQFAFIRKLTCDGRSEDTQQIKLYDISPSGIGLRSDHSQEFEKGSRLMLMGINTKMLSRPLSGTVMSVRYMEEENFYKIGIQFD